VSAPALLNLGAQRAARWLALRFLDDARAGRGRLDDADDDEALHDFRVALRRLRSTVRAYREHLRDSVGGKDRRRLRRLARATGASRDGEVMIAWMQEHRERLSADECPGADWLLHRLRREQERQLRRMNDEVVRDFARACGRLSRRLSWYPAHVSLDDPREAPPMRAVLADLVEKHASELRDALAAVQSIDQQDRAHQARIDAKRLRYLLEPFTDELPGAGPIVKRIKQLQDVFGQMHDAHVAAGIIGGAREQARALDPPADPDPLPGLDALAGIARAETERLYRKAEEWLGGGADEFFAAVGELVAELRGGGRDREIERKYLLRGMPTLPGGAVCTAIAQGYLPGERLNERVRRVRRGGEIRYYRTIKMGSGLSRLEVEEETTQAVFRHLWRLTRGKRVRKLRFRVDEGDFTWEIDRFRGRRLVLAEVELPSEDADAPIPTWLEPFVEREVTGDRDYVNINLAS
jgi:CHAD domain-containing protein/CYTH domain-containing protein